jgi:hypothetical protein
MHPVIPAAPRRRFARALVVTLAGGALLACGDHDFLSRKATDAVGARNENQPASTVTAAPMLMKARVASAPAAADGSGGATPSEELSDNVSPADKDGVTTSTAEPRPGAMLVRTATITIRVDSLERAIERARALARQMGGVLGGAEISTGEQSQRSASLELRIPSDRFDEALTGVSPLGTVEHSTTGAEDVGEEFVDMGARVVNGHRIEERLLNLLATRAGKLSDVLMLERELARVRGEIERAEGRRRYLGRRAAMSTITLALHEPLPILQRDPGEHPIRDAVVAMWRNFTGLVAFGVASLGYVVPLVLLGFVGYRVRRGMRSAALPAAAPVVSGD